VIFMMDRSSFDGLRFLWLVGFAVAGSVHECVKGELLVSRWVSVQMPGSQNPPSAAIATGVRHLLPRPLTHHFTRREERQEARSRQRLEVATCQLRDISLFSNAATQASARLSHLGQKV